MGGKPKNSLKMFNPEIRKYYDAGIGGDALKGAGEGAALGSIIPGVGTLIGGAAGAVIGGAVGFFQKKKGNALLKKNPYPNQPIPAEELANQQAAQNMALEGMPSEQYQAANKNIQRQQAAALFDSQDRRVGSANVAAIQQNTNDATGNLDAQSAAIRRQNQLNLQNVNSGVAAYRDKAFDWNQKQKYLQDYQYGMSLVGSGNANMMSGSDKLLGGLTGAYANGLFSGRGNGTAGNGLNVAPTWAAPGGQANGWGTDSSIAGAIGNAALT